MKHDGFSLRMANYSRCMPLGTGEDVPEGQSLLSRLMILEVFPEDIKQAVLTTLQSYLGKQSYAKAMSSYLKWLAPKIGSLGGPLLIKQTELRDAAAKSALHKRTPAMVASLMVGFEMFLEFAFEAGAISDLDRQKYKDSAWAALGDAAERQLHFQLSEDPVLRWVELLRAAFISGRAHLVDSKTQGKPDRHRSFGWGERPNGDIIAQGDKIGWYDKDKNEIWLNPDLSYSVAQRIALTQHAKISIGKEGLWRRLVDRGFIKRSEKENKNQLKRTPGGEERTRVLVVTDPGLLTARNNDSEADCAPKAPENNGGPLGGGLFSPKDIDALKERFGLAKSKAKNDSEQGVHS
jgi:hypothetical protein